MKYRPILFKGEMVRAILDGQKTQTRRILKLPKKPEGFTYDLDRAWADVGLGAGGYLKVPVLENGVETVDRVRSRYCVCDRLWVRETWKPWSWDDNFNWIAVKYRADEKIEFIDGGLFEDEDADQQFWIKLSEEMEDVAVMRDEEPSAKYFKWRPSIFMPRKACRIYLEITDIRVERLQDISYGDAKAEGVKPVAGDFKWDYLDGFQMLWDSITKKRCYAWYRNPWVWVIEFKLLDGGEP